MRYTLSALCALCLISGPFSVGAQKKPRRSKAATNKEVKTKSPQTTTPAPSILQVTDTVRIPLESSFKPKPKREPKVKIVPAPPPGTWPEPPRPPKHEP